MGNGAVADDNDTEPGPGSSKAKWVVIFIALLGVGLFIGWVLYNEEIRRDLFWQRATMVAMIVAIVVVFVAGLGSRAQLSFTPLNNMVSPAGQGVTFTILGAGALFYLLFGPVWDRMFPMDQTFSGNIYYRTDKPEDGLRPVADVVVQVPQTDQRSQATGREGRFTITNLAFRPPDLNALYGDTTYPFKPGKFQANQFAVIPLPVLPPSSQRADIAASEWIDAGNTCANVNTAGYKSVRVFVLPKSFPVITGYKNMTVKIAAQPPYHIIDAQKERPENEGFEDQLTDDRVLARQWSIPARGSEIQGRFSVCVGAKRGSLPPVRNSLSSTYWFGP